MKAWGAQITAALAANALAPRDFLWVQPRDRTTGERVGWGAWSDLGSVLVDVRDPVAGVTVRPFEGAGSLISVSRLSMVAGLQVQALEITLSQVAPHAESLVRQYDTRQAPMTLFRGWLNLETMRLVAPAEPVFIGFVDGAPITTPAEGGEGNINLVCSNHVQELTRSIPATRSDADQRARAPGDAFYQAAASVGTWQIKWKAS